MFVCKWGSICTCGPHPLGCQPKQPQIHWKMPNVTPMIQFQMCVWIICIFGPPNFGQHGVVGSWWLGGTTRFAHLLLPPGVGLCLFSRGPLPKINQLKSLVSGSMVNRCYVCCEMWVDISDVGHSQISWAWAKHKSCSLWGAWARALFPPNISKVCLVFWS